MKDRPLPEHGKCAGRRINRSGNGAEAFSRIEGERSFVDKLSMDAASVFLFEELRAGGLRNARGIALHFPPPVDVFAAKICLSRTK